MITVSEGNSIIREDLQKWFKNSVVFAAPLLVIYLTFVSGQIQIDGIEPSDFVPSNELLAMLVLYIINVLLDFFMKFAGETKYIIREQEPLNTDPAE